MKAKKWGRYATMLLLVVAIMIMEDSGRWVSASWMAVVLVFGFMVNIDITVNHHTGPDL